MRGSDDTKCPFCNKPLTSDEYARAHSQMEERIKRGYEEESKRRNAEHKGQIKKLEDRHKEEAKRAESIHAGELEKMRKELEAVGDRQLKALEERYEKIAKQNEQQSKKMEAQLKRNYDKMIQDEKKRQKESEKDIQKGRKRELDEKIREIRTLKKGQADLEKDMKKKLKDELGEKDREIAHMKREQTALKREIRGSVEGEYANRVSKLQNELQEKDIQIKRVNKELEEMKIAKKQSELSGEAGEIDLYDTLTRVFTEDMFKRQKRGTSSGDLIQRIRTPTGFLDTQIVYDNKAARTVSKGDIEKAKKYKNTHGTNYVIIVASSMPKTWVPNGLLGSREGVLLVSHSIVVEVARQIRTGIIEISRLANSKEDRDAKQARLYEYVNSIEFSMIIESFHNINQELLDLQGKEERAHAGWWKSRKFLYEKLQSASNNLSGGIDSITQKEVIVEMQ